MPVSDFIESIQSSLKRSNESCDIDNSKFIRDYLTELPESTPTESQLILSNELDSAISSGSMDQVEVVYKKIKESKNSDVSSSHRLKTISVSMPKNPKTGDDQAPVEIPLVSLAALPSRKITKLTLKTPLELVIDNDDEVCVRFPDRQRPTKNGGLDATSPSELTTLDMVFYDNDLEMKSLIKSFEKLARKV